MYNYLFSFAVLVISAAFSTADLYPQQAPNSSQLLTNIDIIQRQWGEVTPYYDNTDDYFGVQAVGLPDGCQIEQAHSFERHGARFPTGGSDPSKLSSNQLFAAKVVNWTAANSTQQFTGPLTFLNGYRYILGSEYLVALGASQSFQAGLAFWQRYGRILFNQTATQLAYNTTSTNGTARPKPVLRTTSQSRIQNTQINWALGFFGPSFQRIPDRSLANWNSEFDTVIIPEGGIENNTLASYDSCPSASDPINGALGDLARPAWIARYLVDATSRLQQYAPSGFTFTVNDTYAMQDICAYEYNYLGSSDFCTLFTADEWAGFELSKEIQYYYDYSFGSPTGRAQGIGYVQELIARLTNQYITTSNSSVNSTLDSDPATFPLFRPFYADFSHDDIIISILTALSLDYIKDAPSSYTTEFPPSLSSSTFSSRRFKANHLVPFAARLVTEVIGCTSSDPSSQPSPRQFYTPTQYDYDPSAATHKFIRMRLNNGILPLETIRGGACAIDGRTDGLCPLDKFLESQADAFELSNYQYACFGEYTVGTELVDYDGTINETYVASMGNRTVVQK